MNPRRYVTKALAALQEAADPRVAAQARTYFKPHEKVAVLGVGTPAIRRLETQLFNQVREAWHVEDAISCCELLLKKQFLECKAVGILTLSRYRKTFPSSLAGRAESWLIEDRCANWASCDSMSGLIVAPLLLKYPELLENLNRWARSNSLWLRRAAAVSQIPLVRKGMHLDRAFEVASALLADREDLMHKAVGWLLRETGKVDRRRLESFLLARGPEIPRTALRYAIERLPRARRSFLLNHTKRWCDESQRG